MNEHLKFKRVKATRITKLHLPCPSCTKPAGTIDHLKGHDVESMWYCDHCGSQIAFKLKNGNLQTALTGERVDKTLVLLREDNIGLIVEGMRFLHKDGTNDTSMVENDAYFYDEHTCPTNYMRHVKAVIDLGNADVDPHGIFRYVCTLPWEPSIEEPTNTLLLDSLRHHFQK